MQIHFWLRQPLHEHPIPSLPSIFLSSGNGPLSMSLGQVSDPPGLFVPLLLFFLSPRQDHGCCTAASAWAQCLHYSQGAVGVCEGRGEQIWCPLPPPRAKESLFRILRRQCLIIAEKGLARGGQELSPTECPRPRQERGRRAGRGRRSVLSLPGVTPAGFIQTSLGQLEREGP